MKALTIPVTYKLGRCTKMVQPTNNRSSFGSASATGGPKFTIDLGGRRELILERWYDSKTHNHPFVVRYITYGRPFGWTWKNHKLSGCITHFRARDCDCRKKGIIDHGLFLKRALAVLGCLNAPGISVDPSRYNLGALHGWFSKMEKSEKSWMWVDRREWLPDEYRKYDWCGEDEFITRAAIVEYFKIMPTWHNNAHNHQLHEEHYDLIRSQKPDFAGISIL